MMYVGIEYNLKMIVENACSLFYALTEICKMKTKEELMKEKHELQAEFEKIQTKIDRLPYSQLSKLRWLCKEQQDIFNKIKALDFKIQQLW